MRAAGDELHANLMLCSYYGDKVMCVDRYWTDDSIESSYARGRPFPMFRGATAAHPGQSAALPAAQPDAVARGRDPRGRPGRGLG